MANRIKFCIIIIIVCMQYIQLSHSLLSGCCDFFRRIRSRKSGSKCNIEDNNNTIETNKALQSTESKDTNGSTVRFSASSDPGLKVDGLSSLNLQELEKANQRPGESDTSDDAESSMIDDVPSSARNLNLVLKRNSSKLSLDNY